MKHIISILQCHCMGYKYGYERLFQFSEAKAVHNHDKIMLLTLFIAGCISITRFADWWFRPSHIGNWWLYIILSLFIWYSIGRLVLIWVNYLKIQKPPHVKPESGLTVAIFTTSSPGEPLEMFEKTLAACRKIQYPHTTYLLDDTKDPRFKECAERHGAIWLELVGIPGAKAGKINAALSLTKEEFILVLDPDHIPFPNFFDHTLGYFQDEKVGFVQVAQAYYNQYRSFTASGAAEQTYTFYGPTQMGLFGIGGAVAIGANCTFRRKALESAGGHGIGLAEDLITSIRIHAAGWKSIYNPVVISRGLVPEDFGSFCKQQLKWARGVFEVTFVELPRLFRKLTGWQRLSYFTIGTYYLNGLTTLFFTLLPFLFFLFGVSPMHVSFSEFLVNGGSIVVIAVAIYLYVQKWMSHTPSERGLHLRGMILKYACWPVFFLGFLLAVVDADIPYIPTAKKASIGSISPFARPLLLQSLLFLLTISTIIIVRKFFLTDTQLLASREIVWAMAGFSSLSFIMSLCGLYFAAESKRMKAENAWDKVDTAHLIHTYNGK
ncbi:MAG: glycosyltransferase [Bacteroidetes bacterium]|nr:glycosyltransferase [Bacteroidota bacterium]